MGATLACDGRNPLTGRDVVSPTVVRTVRALMMTCGMYDGSGEFAVDVGIPAKSGVGGGIDTPSRAGRGWQSTARRWTSGATRSPAWRP